MKRFVLGLIALLLCTPLSTALAGAPSAAGAPPTAGAAGPTQPAQPANPAGAGRPLASAAQATAQPQSAQSTPQEPGAPLSVTHGELDTETAGVADDRPVLGGTPDHTCLSAVSICLHWTTSGPNAATATYRSEVVTTLEHVAEVYQQSGFRSPEADEGAGSETNPNGYIDVYLSQLAPDDVYGYCTPEQAASPRTSHDASAYCVIDNDFTDPIFDAHSPLQNLQVTLAHEFFHAVQFAYDYEEDSWFMEATATWAEDQLYTSINDNRQYLPYGPLGHPRTPLDDNEGGANVYGDWIFFRYLTERFPTRQGQLPELILQMWTAAARSGVYSTQAITDALKLHHTTLAGQFSGFVDANRHPKQSYSEGAAYHVAAPYESLSVGTAHPSRHSTRVVKHLAAVTERFTRSTASKTHLLVTVTTKHPGISAARVSVWLKDGQVRTYPIWINTSKGKGSVKVPFGTTVSRAELTLANTSTFFHCNTGNRYSCDGTPTYDSLSLSWTAALS